MQRKRREKKNGKKKEIIVIPLLQEWLVAWHKGVWDLSTDQQQLMDPFRQPVWLRLLQPLPNNQCPPVSGHLARWVSLSCSIQKFPFSRTPLLFFSIIYLYQNETSLDPSTLYILVSLSLSHSPLYERFSRKRTCEYYSTLQLDKANEASFFIHQRIEACCASLKRHFALCAAKKQKTFTVNYHLRWRYLCLNGKNKSFVFQKRLLEFVRKKRKPSQ